MTIRQFRVESDIPMVKDRNQYPFGDMEVGDSFLFGGEQKDAQRVRVAANTWGVRQEPRPRFTVRKAPLEGENAFRCWRVV